MVNRRRRWTRRRKCLVSRKVPATGRVRSEVFRLLWLRSWPRPWGKNQPQGQGRPATRSANVCISVTSKSAESRQPGWLRERCWDLWSEWKTSVPYYTISPLFTSGFFSLAVSGLLMFSSISVQFAPFNAPLYPGWSRDGGKGEESVRERRAARHTAFCFERHSRRRTAGRGVQDPSPLPDTVFMFLLFLKSITLLSFPEWLSSRDILLFLDYTLCFCWLAFLFTGKGKGWMHSDGSLLRIWTQRSVHLPRWTVFPQNPCSYSFLMGLI